MRTTSILKMLQEDEHSRQICKFPHSFRHNSSPYWEEDFNEITKNICRCGNSAFLSSLKVCKVIILGDLSVGKTCIVNRFCHQRFDTGYKATIGVDFEVERFDILNVPFHLQIWDTAGQERFKCIAQSYYRSAHVIILVFDFTNISTLSHCKKWLDEALNASGSEDPFIFLVGTKKDLVLDTYKGVNTKIFFGSRIYSRCLSCYALLQFHKLVPISSNNDSQATYENIEISALRIAHHLLAEYWPVSSKTEENISKMFFRVAALTFNKCILREKEKSDVIIESELISFKNKPRATSSSIHCTSRKCKNI